MFNKFKMVILFTGLLVVDVQASLQVAIPARDFRAGNSLVLIARDGNGCEEVAGYVSFDDGKTEYSQAEISTHNPTLSSITQQSIAQQRSAILVNLDQDEIEQDDEGLIYLYFDVNPKYNIVRVLVIKNNLLADNPFNIVQFSTSSTSVLDDEEDDDDFCFDMQDNDELSNLNLTDVQGTEPVKLSNYDKMVLGLHALWAVQSAQVKKTYQNIKAWFASQHAK